MITPVEHSGPEIQLNCEQTATERHGGVGHGRANLVSRCRGVVQRKDQVVEARGRLAIIAQLTLVGERAGLSGQFRGKHDAKQRRQQMSGEVGSHGISQVRYRFAGFL